MVRPHKNIRTENLSMVFRLVLIFPTDVTLILDVLCASQYVTMCSIAAVYVQWCSGRALSLSQTFGTSIGRLRVRTARQAPTSAWL